MSVDDDESVEVFGVEIMIIELLVLKLLNKNYTKQLTPNKQ